MLTQKQELFTQNIFSGMTQRDAWIKAGYSSNYPVEDIDSNACTLANSTKIKQRYQELIDASTSPLVADRQELLEFLTEVIRLKPEDVMELSEDGRDLRIKPEAMKSPAVSYIRTQQIAVDRMPVRITKLGMIDKIKSTDSISKLLGYYNEPPPGDTTFITSFNFILPDGTKVTPKQLREGITQEKKRPDIDCRASNKGE